MGSTRKSAWFPNTSREHATPAVHENRVARTVFTLKDLVTSSRVKRVPPIGALKATARPAPPSAVCIILTSESGSRARLAASAPIAAPMCTVGPSRPSTRPDPMLSTPPTNFAGSRRICGGLASARKTASTCWIPLPAANGSHRTITAARVAPSAAAAMGTSQPGPGSLCAQSTRSMRRSSAICRHQRNAPPTKPMTTPATIAVTQIPTVPRVDSSGWRGPAACAVIRRRTLPGWIPPRGIVKRMTEVDHSQHHTDTDHAEHGHGGHGGHHDHVAQFRRLFWIMAVLAVPTVALSPMFAMILGYSVPQFAGSAWVSPVLGTVMYFWGGRPFLTGAISEIRSRAPGMMLLIALAISVAFISSWAASLGALDHQLDFWWELALLIVIMLLGHWIEMRSLAQTSSALDSLAALLPDEAERVVGDDIVGVAPSDLRLGDVVIVRPGGSVPADGEIVDGTADINESMVTGESVPVRRGVGDDVVAGTVAMDSGLRIRVTAVGDDTALAGIQRLVTEAQNSTSRAQRLADTAAGWLFWFALGAAVITAVVWGVVGRPEEAVIRTITVLVIACPHALGLAIPLVVSIATERAARAGVLVKDRLALESMRTVGAVLFDKTGTLTKGEPTVTAVTAVGYRAEDDVLAVAAAAESDSEHPLAKAIVDAARRRGLCLPRRTSPRH